MGWHGDEPRRGGAVRPLTLAWVSRHLEVGERIVRTEALHGGITAEMRRLTIGTRDGGTRDLVLRTFVDPFFVEHAEDGLNREADALTLLAGTGVPAPGLVAVDPTAAHCEYPSLLMTHLAGRTVLDDEGLETRVPLLARQLVAIHAAATRRAAPGVCDVDDRRHRRPSEGRRRGGMGRGDRRDPQARAALRRALPAPGLPPRQRAVRRAAPRPAGARITGVVDWADLLGPGGPRCGALLHQPRAAPRPGWGLRFAEAYEEAGGVLAAAASERLYWRVLDALAFSEVWSRWRGRGGRRGGRS
jgi:hypothetical protein